MQKIFILFFILFAFFPSVFANIKITSLLPNPDDGQKEQVTITNLGCNSVDITGFSLQKIDTNKNKIFETKILEKFEVLNIETNNFLKNSGDELILLDSGKTEIDKVVYTDEQAKKGEKINFEHNFENCENNFDNQDKDSTNNSETENKNEENTENTENENIEETKENQKIIYPVSLNYGDSDENNLTDFIELEFEENLPNGLDFSKINIFSKENGLYKNSTNDNSSVLSGSLDGNFLKIFIKESDFEFKNLNIDNSDNSELKIFLNEEYVWKYENGQKIFLFPDEQNFENTKINHPYNENKNQNNFEIIPILQSGTDAIFEEKTFYCIKQNCKLNLDFTNDFSSKDYFCTITFGEKIIKNCNPSTQIVKNSDKIKINFVNKKTKVEFNDVFDVDFSKIPKENTNKNSSKNNFNYSSPPEIFVEPQGNYEKEFIWNENSIECFYSTCAVNLTASGTFSYEKNSLKYNWKFGKNIEKTGKNPSTVVFEVGEHNILLTVSDNYGSFSNYEILVKVPENKPKNQKIETNTEEEKNLKTKNEEKIFEYSEPEFVIQGRTNVTEDEDGYIICRTKTDLCSVNFALQNTQKEMKYYWYWNDENFFESKNPKSKQLSIGDHKLVIKGFYEKNFDKILYEKILIVRVEKIIPEKKTKTVKKTTTKTTTKSNSKINESDVEIKNSPDESFQKKVIEAEKIEQNDGLDSDIVLSLAGMCFVSSCFPFFRRRK